MDLPSNVSAPLPPSFPSGLLAAQPPSPPCPWQLPPCWCTRSSYQAAMSPSSKSSATHQKSSSASLHPKPKRGGGPSTVVMKAESQLQASETLPQVWYRCATVCSTPAHSPVTSGLWSHIGSPAHNSLFLTSLLTGRLLYVILGTALHPLSPALRFIWFIYTEEFP